MPHDAWAPFLLRDSASGMATVERRKRLRSVAVLVAATLAAHAWALGDGLFLDDHLHQARLAQAGWSWSDLLEVTTIEPAQFMHAWWQDKTVRWQYPRPFAVLLAKTVHALTGGSVVAQHAVSLVLHFATALMVFHLCLLLTRRVFWSLIGGLFLVVYSHGVFAVAWLAAQNAVLQTALMLAALLCYVRASGLLLGPVETDVPAPGDGTSLAGATSTSAGSPRPVPSLRRRWFAASLALWVLALFSRENAIVLPALLVAFDLSFGRREHVRARRGAYVLFGLLGGAFIIWRVVHAYHPMPDFYFRRPDGDGYLLWCLAKLMHYLCSAVWLSPMTIGPTGRFDPFREVPGDCLLMATILAVMGTGYYLMCRRARGYWIWPLWLVLTFLPVVPVMATPHSGYLAGVGFAVAMVLGPALGPALGQRARPRSGRRWPSGVSLWFLAATCCYIPVYRFLWQAMLAGERYTIEALAHDPPSAGVTDVFFINLPFVNVYAQQCLRDRVGPSIDPMRCHVLTYSPDLISMEQPCVLEQLDAHRFSVSVDGRPFFSGALGRFLIEGMRGAGPFRAGEAIGGDAFDVRIAEADDTGVRKLVFAFHKPLASPRYRFYLTTRRCAAAPLRFRDPTAPVPALPPLAKRRPSLDDVRRAAERLKRGQASAADTLFTALHSPEPAVQQAASTVLRPVVGWVAEALGAPWRPLVDDHRPSSADLARVRAWWFGTLDDQLLESLWVRRREHEALRSARNALADIRHAAARVIHTDLYLTGPPYPGPRAIRGTEEKSQRNLPAVASAARRKEDVDRSVPGSTGSP